MSSFTLSASSALDEASYETEGLQLHELAEIKIVSIAANKNQQIGASQTLMSNFKLQWPAVGQSSGKNNSRALGMQDEQIFLLFDKYSNTQVQQLATVFSASAYVTDQSDSWAAVALSGVQRHAALERICTLDLHESVFEDGSVARTAMEYLSVIIVRDNDRFILLSPRSSARSFWHMLTVSARYTSNK